MEFRWKIVLGVSLVAFITMYALVKQGENESEDHIHALAFDPTDVSALYIATHEGLLKYTKSKSEPVGRLKDDLMGFTISSDGTFYTSGHSKNVPDVGVRKSVDKGQSWQTLAYEGMDFHNIVMSNADPNIIYAWSTPPHELLVLSKDGGETWVEIDISSFKKSIFTLAADHQRPNVLYSGVIDGVYISKDYGATWSKLSALSDNPTAVVTDEPKVDGIMYAVVAKKGVLKTFDGGNSWTVLNEGLPDPTKDVVVFLAASPHDDTLYTLTRKGLVYKHDGINWQQVSLIGHG